MEQRKQWKSLYMINKKVFFLGFSPAQWMMIACLLFMIGFFYWPLAVGLIIPVYLLGRKVSRLNTAGNPDFIKGLIVWLSIKKYFIDSESLFTNL
jgi:hypothetical protein